MTFELESSTINRVRLAAWNGSNSVNPKTTVVTYILHMICLGHLGFSALTSWGVVCDVVGEGSFACEAYLRAVRSNST